MTAFREKVTQWVRASLHMCCRPQADKSDQLNGDKGESKQTHAVSPFLYSMASMTQAVVFHQLLSRNLLIHQTKLIFSPLSCLLRYFCHSGKNLRQMTSRMMLTLGNHIPVFLVSQVQDDFIILKIYPFDKIMNIFFHARVVALLWNKELGQVEHLKKSCDLYNTTKTKLIS